MELPGPTFETPRSPERAPAPPAPERPRRNLFELFGRKKTPEAAEAKPKTVEVPSERKAEKAVEAVDAPQSASKRLGERLLAAVGIKPQASAETAAERQPAEANKEATDTQPEKPAPVIERLAESARRLGRNVLQVIGNARETVEAADAADTTEARTERTDTKPLDKAERKVESALDELDEAEGTGSRSGGDSDGDNRGDGGEYPQPMVEIPLSSLRAMQESAAAEAFRDAERQIEAEQERQQNRLARRQVGALAIGALLVAGVTAAYSWRKIRHLRHEQVDSEKREVKQQKALKESEARIDQMEREQQEHPPMDRRERQAYVTEVSHYASAQAEQIREVAQDVREQQVEQNFLRVPEYLKVEVKQPEETEIKKVIVERAGEVVGGKVHKASDALAGGVAGVGSIVDFISGKIIQPVKDLIQQNPPTDTPVRKVAHDPVQTWLNGVLLILGVLLLLAILLAIW